MIDIPEILTRMCIASESGPVIRTKWAAKERNTPAQKTGSHSSPHLMTGCRIPHSNPRQSLGTAR